MKKIILFTLVLLITNTIFGQAYKALIGEDVTVDAECLLVLKNGNIVVSTFNKDSKNVIDIYNSNLQLIVEKEVKYKTRDIAKIDYSKSEVLLKNKTFEIGGKIVMFLNVTKNDGDKRFCLYRIIINANTAEIEKEELMLTINGKGMFTDSYLSAFGVDDPSYIISKDDNSDYYAVIKYIYQKRNDAVCNYEIHHYSPEHKEINYAKFDYGDNKYNYARPLNLSVFADKYLIIASFVFNSEKLMSKDTKVLFSKLDKKENTFIHQQLDYTKNFSTNNCDLKRDKKNNSIEALIYLQNRNYKNEILDYSLVFQGINPEKMELTKAFDLPHEMVNDYVIKNCNSKKGFDKPAFLNYKVKMNGNYMAYIINTQFIGVTEFDSNGSEITAWAYPHSENDYLIPICTSNGNYLITEDMDDNMNKPLGEKFKKIEMEKSNPILLTFKDNGEIVKDYIFGKPEKGKNIYMQPSSFNKSYFYDDDSKTLIARISIGKDHLKQKLAMIKFE